MSEEPLQWYVFKCQTKREHVAAEHARRRVGVEVFCPRVSFRRKTRRGMVRFIEALFPGYLFVRCALPLHKRHLMALEGIVGVVHFGSHVPTVEEAFIESIREECPEEMRALPDPQFTPGEEVIVAEGPLREVKAIFANYLPAKQRVSVLLEILGQTLTIEVPAESVYKDDYDPMDTIRTQQNHS
jgi:transcriptional antiterminator RfaH